MNYTKEKNDLEIKFQKEKYQLLNKFKNQIKNFENYNNEKDKLDFKFKNKIVKMKDFNKREIQILKKNN